MESKPKKAKRIICIVLAVIAFLFIVLIIMDRAKLAVAAQPDYWMADLDDDMMISEVTIPGTHDSGTQYLPLGYVMRCQSTDITTQLENGYRYLDMRLAIQDTDDGSQLIVVHNFAKCHESAAMFSDYLSFDDVCQMVYDFLDGAQSEAVILNIKIEDEDHSVAQIQKLLHKEIAANSSYWLTDNEIPTVGEARGRIVLATRFEDAQGLGETGLQMMWDDQGDTAVVDMPYELTVSDSMRLWVQDRYNYDVDDKYEAVIDGLENCEADAGTVFLNFVSTSGKGAVGHPLGYAKQLNELLMNYDLKENTSYGIIIVDFGDAELAKHIYDTNF